MVAVSPIFCNLANEADMKKLLAALPYKSLTVERRSAAFHSDRAGTGADRGEDGPTGDGEHGGLFPQDDG